MQPPHPDDHATGTAAGRLDELSRAVRAGRLVTLLKGDGLNKSTVEELLRPGSLSALKAILNDHLFSSEPERKDDQAAALSILFGTEER